MNRITTVLLTLLLIPVFAFAGTTGKLKGKVTDQSTGEALIGANVIIVGTSYGAATDVNGEFTILNLDAGTFDVRCSYIGYQSKAISNVRINADLTTELDFSLAAEGVSVGEIEVVAERPLINKSNTNANRITTSDDIDALPVRGINNILALTPGVVLQDNTLFIRGGRQDEVGYYLEGTNITDPVVGGRKVTLVQDALEEIQVQAGGYNAEFGGANSGIVRQQIKSGTPNFKASLEFTTDNFLRGFDFKYDGDKSLGTYNWGYNEATATLSGPIYGNVVKFFGLFNYNFMRDQNPQPYPGMDLGYITDQATGDSVNFSYPAGPLFKNSLENYTGTGSLTFDFNPVIFRAVGTYNSSTSFNPFSSSRNSGNIANLLNNSRTEQVDQTDGAFSLKGTLLINPTTYVELNGGYSFSTLNRFDPVLKDDFLSYGDSVANANAGYVWNRRPATNQGRYVRQPFYQIFTFAVNAPGDVVAGYQKYNRSNINFNGALSAVIQKTHTLKVGGEFQMYDIKNYSFGNEGVFALPGLLENKSDPDSIRKIYINRGVNNYGYDIYGKEYTGSDMVDKAHQPVFAAGYIQDKIEYNDLIVNIGFRYDYINIDNFQLYDPTRPELTFDKTTGEVWDVNGDGSYISPEGNKALVEVPTFSSVSPRLGFSFPVTDQTVFHAQYGKFVQQSRLRDVYQGYYATSSNIGGGFFIPAPVGFNVRPTRTTQYEIGFTQQIGDFASFDLTGFYKDIQDQVVYSQVNTNDQSIYGGYFVLTNGDFATTKGLEISFNMRRFERFMVNGSVTFQDARGTGSFPNSNRGIVGAPLDGVTIFEPQYVSPLEYNNDIRGNFNFDYHFGVNDGGPILQQLGLSALLTFTSGHPYTQGIGGANLEGDARDRQPTEALNSSTTPSTFQVDLRVDKSFNLFDMLNLNVYVYVINLFDITNIQNVFLRTGTTDDDGYLSDPQLGGTLIQTYGPEYEALYKAINIDYYQQWQAATTGAAYTTSPFFFGTPRQIRLGLKLDL
jgi:CarboxypepD_reg-like domain